MRKTAISYLFIIFLTFSINAQNFNDNDLKRSEFLSISNGSSFTAAVKTNSEQNIRTAHDIEREAFDMLNKIRQQRGMHVLTWNESMAEIARSHSKSMATENFFSHTGKDGKTVDERADGFGLTEWRSIGENIAFIKGVDKPADLAVKKWMESTSHRNNILKSNWSESAIGVVVISGDTYYFTQVFWVK